MRSSFRVPAVGWWEIVSALVSRRCCWRHDRQRAQDKRGENEVTWKVTIDEVKARSYNLDFKNPHTVEEDHGDPAELLAKLEASEADTARLRDRLKVILEEALLR